MQQAKNAILETRSALQKGATDIEAVKAGKEDASFSGAMRINLVAMLDDVGISKVLGLKTCASLFDEDKALVHYTSALRYPVLHKGKNYSGSSNMLKISCLHQQVETYLAEEVKALSSDCIYIPLGPNVTPTLVHLQEQGLLKAEQIIAGLPHPSSPNNERISYFLGKKAKGNLSKKTNAAKLDAARTLIMNKVASLGYMPCF